MIRIILSGVASILFTQAAIGTALADSGTATTELAPTGKLRVGVVFAPAKTVFFVVKDAAEKLQGVTADLGAALAQKAGIAVEFHAWPNSGGATDALASGEIDVAFFPIDEERKQKVDFGPAYFVAESTYLVRAGSDIKSIAEVDRAEVKVVGIANTASIRSVSQLLKDAEVQQAASVDEALELLRSNQADALALPRDALTPLTARVPGSRILDGAYQRLSIAIAVPKNRPNALAYVNTFMIGAKASGIVRHALDNAGFSNAPVAP
jgi:polar amino acid transport system substrate-binding protein